MNAIWNKIYRFGTAFLAASMLFSTVSYADTMPDVVGAAGFSKDSESEEGGASVPEIAGIGNIITELGSGTVKEQDPDNETGEAAAPSSGTADEDGISAADEHPSVLALESRIKKYDGLYKNVVFPDIDEEDSYINIRRNATSDSEVEGKLFAKAAARVLETVDGEDGPWFKIQSGSVTGYVNALYFITGETAEDMAKQYGTLVAKINTESLRLRAKASVESEQIALLSEDDRYPVAGEEGAFVKLSVDGDLFGYVLDEYVTLSVSYKTAKSIEEEKAEIERQERLERERQEARSRNDDDDRHSSGNNNGGSNNGGGNNTGSSSSKKKSTGGSKPGSSAGSVSGKRESICAFAESYVGETPYVWGGNSLSSGVDCSGFVQQIFKNYGVSLPRTSDSQGYSGEGVSSSEMRPGDIVYYGGHVAIYIGDGMVVHASDRETGIKYSKWNYRTPITIRNVLGD